MLTRNESTMKFQSLLNCLNINNRLSSATLHINGYRGSLRERQIGGSLQHNNGDSLPKVHCWLYSLPRDAAEPDNMLGLLLWACTSMKVLFSSLFSSQDAPPFTQPYYCMMASRLGFVMAKNQSIGKIISITG